MVVEKTLKEIKTNQNDFFFAKKSFSIQNRLKHLKKLRKIIRENEPQIIAALRQDLNKPEAEIWLAEINTTIEELNTIIKNLRYWAKPKRVSSKWINFPSKDWIASEPYGVTLHIAPWNYPFQLALNPIIGAVAAGNTVILKPSEYAPKTAELLKRIITEVFPPEWVYVAQGGPEIAQELLHMRWDYIFFTGGTRIAKLVAKAAAVHLTPTTFELGGKNPCIVDKTANIKVSARRIVWGKFMNCGQVCMSPDYVLVDKSIYSQLVSAMKHEIERMYGKDPKTSPDYARLVHKGHTQHIIDLMEGQTILHGGESDLNDCYVAPTLLKIASLDSKIMEDEIFGPLLPIISYDNENEINEVIRHFEKPLSFYVFSERKKWARRMMRKHSYGGGMINDVVMYFTNEKLPFGGVGYSGTGSYHGKHSFDTFTHYKPYVERSTWFDPKQRYAPYEKTFPLIKKIINLLS